MLRQQDKVFIVTGEYWGIEYHLTSIPYGFEAKVHIAGRSEPSAQQAIREIHATAPNPSGQPEFFHLTSDDLSSIKSSAETSKRKESKSDAALEQRGRLAPPTRQQVRAEPLPPARNQPPRSLPLHPAASPPLERPPAASPAPASALGPNIPASVDLRAPPPPNLAAVASPNPSN
ncbi:MAG: hypothetical protein FRX48_03680 [Lasallia pustulata]|uniref:Uncharacterized protein n=1 Tax=Lasallia pustulata TaxID=136370 RepID=A0A5M8PSY1_9LECA|nr:MAG: hypothetical protein FRX48_03680 [Lasallia pustulata]